MILLVGSNEPLLEGVAQMLAAAGLEARIARDVAEAAATAAQWPPVVVVLDRALAGKGGMLGVRLVPGGAVILYRTDDVETMIVSPAIRRLTLAELSLPLERQRLLALVQSIVAKARVRNDPRVETPPQHRAV